MIMQVGGRAGPELLPVLDLDLDLLLRSDRSFARLDRPPAVSAAEGALCAVLGLKPGQQSSRPAKHQLRKSPAHARQAGGTPRQANGAP